MALLVTAGLTPALGLGLWSSAATGAGKAVTIAKGVRLSFPAGWVSRPAAQGRWAAEHVGAKKGQTDATLVVRVEPRADHAAALAMLGAVDAEYPGKGKYTLIGGWPAIERNISVAFERPGEDGGQPAGGETALQTTTAIAVNNMLVRLDTRLQPGAPAALADQALAVGRRLTLPAGSPQAAEEVRRLQAGAYRPAPPAQPKVFAPAPAKLPVKQVAPRPGPRPAGGVAIGGGGEIEAAVSGDGSRLLADASCSISVSTNFGASFSASTVNTGTLSLDGDCSVSWGQSGAFYLARLGGNVSPWSAPYQIAVFRSTDGGATFNSLGLAVNNAPPFNNVDQPHIAADRMTPSSSGQDSVYLVWQEGWNLDPSVSCSVNSGATWIPAKAAYGGVVAYPRLTVGGGMVYVVSRSGSTAVIDKFSNCDGGLARQANFPVFVNINSVPCPVPGLDRCNNGNWLSSPTIAVDDTNAQHVYLGWADATGTGENILVADSTDGGLHFGTPVAVNSAVTARRFLPWLTVWAGVAHVGWYDRRTATATANDRTRYFRGSVSVVAGRLTPGPEVDLSGVDDPQCASGFPCGVRNGADCLSCSSPPAPGACGSSFTGGCPKYGDYNGIAAGGARLLHVWASATAPVGLPAVTGISAFTSVTSFCGAAGQACCPAGPACNAAGLVCGATRTCVACGSVGAPCCTNQTCNGTLVCAGNTCQCGGGGQPCCDPGSTCQAHLTCVADATGHRSCTCGGLSQACCAGATCSSALLACWNGTCLAACGHKAQPCCKSPSTDQPPTQTGTLPGWCYSGGICTAGSCACGGLNQPCCLSGQSCGPSLVCSNLQCVSSGSSCATCTTNRTQCRTRCGASDAYCLCLCDNSYCGCATANGCGPCAFQSCTRP